MEFLSKIPPELTLPIVVAVGLAGFLAILWASSYSVLPDKLVESEKLPNSPAASSSTEGTEPDQATSTPEPTTPKRSPRTASAELGTFTSPDGIRTSRRLQSKRKSQ